ncbi:MAG: 23S rRNA (adenine(2503)-C(2))-methyltransferase RlmN, partial [Dehalococcoidia bacterium]
MTTPQSPSSEPTAEKASIPSATLPSILDLSRDRLTSTLIEMGEKKFRADQVWRSI